MLLKVFVSTQLLKSTSGHVFGMSGANIEALFDSLTELSLPITIAKNENNAVAMAIGSFLKTKKMSTVATTSGGALLNTLPMVAEAFSSRHPCLIIAGMSASNQEGHGAFQETSGLNNTFDIQKLFDPITCSAIKLKNSGEMPTILSLSIKKALKYKQPAIIFVPSNFWNETIELPTETLAPQVQKIHTSSNLDKYLQQHKSEKPLLVFGSELNTLIEMTALKELLHNRTYSHVGTPEVKGFLNHNSPYFKGLIGVMGHETAFAEFEKSHFIIFIGVKNNIMEMFGLKEVLKDKTVLCLNEFDHYWQQLDKSNDHIIIEGDLSESISSLAKNLCSPHHQPNHLIHNPIIEAIEDDSFNFKLITNIFNQYIPTSSDLFIDAGNTGANAIHYLNPTGDSLYYISLGMGAMGNSIGTAIGSCLASNKKELTYVIIGDGSFLISGLELHTAIEKNLPMVFIIMNNNAHEMCKTRERIFVRSDKKTSGINDFKSTYYAQGFASLFPSLQTYEVNSLPQLIESLEGVKKQLVPSLISINITEETLPPFKSFQTSKNQNLGSKHVQ